MPHIPYSPRPRPGVPAAMPATQAPLLTRPATADLSDVLDVPLPEAAPEESRPNVPFAAPRRRQSLMPKIDPRTYDVSVDHICSIMFQ